MQACTSLQTDNHASTPPLCFLQAASFLQPNQQRQALKASESVLKILIDNTIRLFLKTKISILLISEHNGFRVLFDKIVSVYFIRKIYLYFSTGNGQLREPALIGILSLPISSPALRSTCSSFNKYVNRHANHCCAIRSHPVYTTAVIRQLSRK